jgi:hypothetical protein
VADVRFVFESAPRSAPAFAQRVAVLHRIAGKSPNWSPEAAIKSAEAVLGKWRRVLVQLREVGWGPAQGVRFQYARNCPPAGVVAQAVGRDRVRPCHMLGVCPWCWARERVLATFDRTWEVMLASGDAAAGEVPAERPNRLRVLVATGVSAARDPGDVMAAVGYRIDKTVRTRRGVLAGGLLLATVQPRPAGGWSWTLRSLTLAPAGFPLKPGATEVESPTRRAVAAAVAKFARYPLGMMTADPARVAEVLTARGAFRLYRAFGAFSRNSRPGRRGPAAGQRFIDL